MLYQTVEQFRPARPSLVPVRELGTVPRFPNPTIELPPRHIKDATITQEISNLEGPNSSFSTEAKVVSAAFSTDKKGTPRMYWEIEVKSGLEAFVRGQVRQTEDVAATQTASATQKSVLKGGHFFREETNEVPIKLVLSAEVAKIDSKKPIIFSLSFQSEKNQMVRSTREVIIKPGYLLDALPHISNTLIDILPATTKNGATGNQLRAGEVLQMPHTNTPEEIVQRFAFLKTSTREQAKAVWLNSSSETQQEILDCTRQAMQTDMSVGLLYLYRECPLLTAAQSSQGLLKLANVGAKMAEAILREVEAAPIQGKDIPKSRRDKYVSQLAEDKIASLYQKEDQYSLQDIPTAGQMIQLVDNLHTNKSLPPMFGFDDINLLIKNDRNLSALAAEKGMLAAQYKVLFCYVIASDPFLQSQVIHDETLLSANLALAIDRTPYQTLSAYFHPGSVARLVGVSEEDLVMSNQYKAVREIAENFFSANDNPYTSSLRRFTRPNNRLN
jgi:hypothetical protein